MKATVEMGEEEFIKFVQFEEERPQLKAEIARLQGKLYEIADIVTKFSEGKELSETELSVAVEELYDILKDFFD